MVFQALREQIYEQKCVQSAAIVDLLFSLCNTDNTLSKDSGMIELDHSYVV